MKLLTRLHRPFTMHRWRSSPWQMYQLLFISWASMWQIIETTDHSQVAISVANMAGATIALLGLHLKDTDTARALERWAYLALVWSMSCYLALALQYEGWIGLVRQPNFGIVLAEAVIAAAIHRFIWTLVARPLFRRKVRKEADRMACTGNLIKE